MQGLIPDMAIFKRSTKIKVMFVDETNDLQSQVAEFFLNDMFGGAY